jgi:hypothetical protein
MSWRCSSARHSFIRRGDVRGEAESLFWVGCFHQVVRRDNDAAVPVLQRSCELAAQVGDKLTMSDALRQLGIAEHVAGRADKARERPAGAHAILSQVEEVRTHIAAGNPLPPP